jgi:O-antigen/teichoic acid export membrane protein
MLARLRQAAAGGGANLVLRAATLALRFGLSFYVVSVLGLHAAGTYGLALGAIGIAPAVIGWGLNYFVAREVVGLSPDAAASLVKTRLTVTLASLCLLTLAGGGIAALAGHQWQHVWLLVVVLIWFETLALDLYLPLIGLELATEANVIVFVRSALWVPAVVGLGIAWPEWRTLDALFAFWIASHVLSLALMAWFLRRWPVAARLAEPIDRSWIRDRLGRSWYIYLSDVGIVGSIFLDRYIVSAMLGLAATGIYTFYWSIANALQTLMQTSVVQLALPKMVKAYGLDDIAQWRRLLKAELLKAIVIAIGLALAMFVTMEVVFRIDPGGRFPRQRDLYLLLLLTAVMRAGSDLLNVCITSTGRDRYYAASNIGGVILSLAFAFAGISLFGLVGSGIGALTTAVILLASRLVYLRHVLRSEQSRRRSAGAASVLAAETRAKA